MTHAAPARAGTDLRRAENQGRSGLGAHPAGNGVSRFRRWRFADAVITLRGMPLRVQYKDVSGKKVLAFPSPERAIEAACLLIDRGYQVLSIGAAAPADTISEIEIARIYAIWAREKKPFG